MISYLIKSMLCMALFYLVYVIWLEKESMHRLKRFYLLGSLIFALIIPLITLHITLQTMPEWMKWVQHNPQNIHVEAPEMNHTLNSETIAWKATNAPIEKDVVKPAFDYAIFLAILYVLGTTYLLIRLIRNLYIMVCKTKQKKIFYFKGIKVVLAEDDLVSHSFANCIFVNRKEYETGEFPEEILLHEWTHAGQRHTLDLIFIEILIAVFWLNPLLYLYRNKIKQNHEFLADEAVLSNPQTIIPAYQRLLIKSIDQHRSLRISCKFNFSITKKRLIMMTKTTSKKRARFKAFTLVPVLIVAICVFSTKVWSENNRENAGTHLPEHLLQEDPIIIPGKGISQDQMDEYQEITEKYITFDDGRSQIQWKSTGLSQEESDKLYVLYVQMDTAQRNQQKIAFMGPFTPCNAKRNPNADEWNVCKNAKAIWLDAKKSDKVTLDALSRKCIILFTYKPGEYSFAWTKKGYTEYIQEYEKGIKQSKLLEIKPNIFYSIRTFKKVNR